MNQDLLRIIDGIAREKNIETEAVFTDLEAAMISGVRKHFGGAEEMEITVQIDRSNGEISAYKDGEQIDIRRFGRIAAQTAKQVMIQKLKADERGSIYAEFVQRKGEIISGSAVRFESGSLVISLNNRTEGLLPKSEQISGESNHPGERIRCLILDVQEAPNQVKIILSRTHPDFIK